MTEKVSKNRQGRTNRRQIEALIEHLEQHPNLASRKFNTINANENFQESWENLTKYLNSLSTDRKQKDVKSWRNTWRDYKSKISEKVQKLRKSRSKTGNNPIDITLSELDKRILGIIGHDYVQGLTTVPDSFPEEHNHAVEELAEGNTESLNVPPTAIIITEINGSVDTDEELIVNNNYNESEIAILENEILHNEKMAMENIPEPSTSQPIIHNRTQNNKQLRKKNNNSKQLSVQFSDAREVFQNIADKQAEAMKSLAESMKLQAEATVKIGEAIDKMAKNKERQTYLLELISKQFNTKNMC